jgi:hypothetical protein
MIGGEAVEGEQVLLGLLQSAAILGSGFCAAPSLRARAP